MKKSSLLICDKDESYIEALVGYFMTKRAGCELAVSISSLSDPMELEGFNGSFDLVLLGEGFWDAFTKQGRGIRAEKILKLSEEPEGKEEEFFKYSSMDYLCDILAREARLSRREGRESTENLPAITGIYSPCKHELGLPFSLCVCKLFCEKEDVLFLDLGEICILKHLLDADFEGDLIDLLYSLSNSGMDGGLRGYIRDFEGIGICAPVAAPAQLSYVEKEEWLRLVKIIGEYGYRKLVIYFGSLIQGFEELLYSMESLLILTKPGDYYSLMDSVFEGYVEKLGMTGMCKKISMPLSARNLTEGGYRLDALINGNLFDAVKKELSHD